MRRELKAVIGFVVASVISYSAKSDTVFVETAPTSIKKSEALADLAADKSVYQCRKAKAGPNINPVNVPGSKVIWAREVGKEVEDVFDLLAAKKPVFRCKLMAANRENGRLQAVPSEESDDE